MSEQIEAFEATKDQNVCSHCHKPTTKFVYSGGGDWACFDCYKAKFPERALPET